MADLTWKQKDYAFRYARHVYQEIWGSAGEVRESRACLFLACSLQLSLIKLHGILPMLQAGSHSWPITTPEHDDGVSPTHFSYRWEGLESPAVINCLRRGSLPELHCWIALRPPHAPKDTIVDPTTWSLRKRAADLGLSWHPSAAEPPEFLWEATDALKDLDQRYPCGVYYQPDVTACAVAGTLAEQDIYPKLAAHLGLRLKVGEE